MVHGYIWLWLHGLSAAMSILLLLSSGNITVFIVLFQVPLLIACGLHYYFNIVEYDGLPKTERGYFLVWERTNKGIAYIVFGMCIVSCLVDIPWLDLVTVILLCLFVVSIISIELMTIRLNTDFCVRRLMILKASLYTIFVLFLIGVLGTSQT